MLPNAILIGAQKCGTTSLHGYLRAHPEIAVARRKPLGFFVSAGASAHDNLPHNWHRGVRWYESQCPSSGEVRVESSPDYTNYPRYRDVPARMHSLLPDARLIYIVRNPLERMVSHWVHNWAAQIEHRSFDTVCAEAIGSSYFYRGCYGLQLQQILAHYDLSRILIITQEGLKSQRRSTLEKVFRFLRVDSEFWADPFDNLKHESLAKRRNNRFALAMDRLIGRRILARLHGRQRYMFRKIFYSPFSKPIQRPDFSSQWRAPLTDAFHEDLEEMARLTGQPFPDLLHDPIAAQRLAHCPA